MRFCKPGDIKIYGRKELFADPKEGRVVYLFEVTHKCQQGSKRAPDMNECDILEDGSGGGYGVAFPT